MRPAWLFSAALAIAALPWAPMVGAQPDPLPATLELGEPTVLDELAVGSPARIQVPWTYAVPAGAILPGATLHWDPPPACDAAGVTVTGNTTQAIQAEAGQGTVTGVATFVATATAEAPGELLLDCSFTAYAESSLGSTAPDSAQARLHVAFLGLIRAYAPVTREVAGPQKQIAFEVHVENLGNSRTIVVFELAPTDDTWRVITPAPLVVDTRTWGADVTNRSTTLIVSTPFQNGPNSGSQDFRLTMTARSSVDNAKVGNTVELNFTAAVDGLYIPGPDSAAPLVLVLAGLAARTWQRRRS